MCWRLIIKEFGPNIQHIYEFDNILNDTLSRLPYKLVEKYETITSKDQCCANKLFTIGREEDNKYCFLLNILNLKIYLNMDMIKINSKLSAYILD